MKRMAHRVSRGTGPIAQLAVLYGAAFLAGFNENLVNMGLVSIMGEYGVDSITAQWLVTGYMIVATVVVMCMAFLYRRIKLRTLFFAAGVFCMAGSAMGLVAANFQFLLAARLVQAIGSGIFIPMMMNTILAVAPKNRLGRFMSIGGCTITFGPAFAPVVCGGLVTAFGWHSIFAVPLAAMAVLGVLGFFLLKNLENAEVGLDVPSVVLATVFLVALSFGLSQIMATPPVGAVALVVAAGAAAAFVVRQGRCASPLIDLTPMRSIRFWPAVVLVVVSMMIMFSLSVLLPLFFEGALGMTAFAAGMVILVPVLVNAGCTLVAGRVLDSRGEWPLLPLGLGIALAGAALMAATASLRSLPVAFVAAVLVYAGIGFSFSPAQTAGLRTLPARQNPFGVALMTTFVQIAACIGPSLFTGIMSAVQDGAPGGGQPAVAQGFSAALIVASCIAAVGFATAFAYARAARGNAGVSGVAPEGPSFAASAEKDAGVLARRRPLAPPTLRSVMRGDPYTLPADACVREALRAMVDHGVGGLPVVDADGRAVGYVSDGDVMRCLADRHPLFATAYVFVEAAANQTVDERLRELMGLPVMQVATTKVVCLDAGTPLKDACEVLARHRYKKVPVVERGRVVGVVNRSDVLRHVLENYLEGDSPDAGSPKGGVR